MNDKLEKKMTEEIPQVVYGKPGRFIPLHAVVRADEYAQDHTVVGVFATVSAAQCDVDRLNKLNADKRCRYYWSPTRLKGRHEEKRTFSEIVSAYLQVAGNEQRTLAEGVQSSVSSVSRWASGETVPGKGMQKIVIAWIDLNDQLSRYRARRQDGTDNDNQL
jgi:hypothetical protein